MNMFEKASSIRDMMQIGGMTQARLATVLGVSQSYVANKIRLLAFSDTVREKILEHSLSERHARCILRLDDEKDQLLAIEKAAAMKMNVARCEIMVDTMLDDINRKKPCGINFSERIGHFEKSLESSLSLLSEIGIRSRVKREETKDMIYFSISIG